jgi:hypothetical protein
MVAFSRKKQKAGQGSLTERSQIFAQCTNGAEKVDEIRAEAGLKGR